MDQQENENKELRITRLEEEIKEARETLWRMMVEDVIGKEIDNATAYVRYLENEKKG